MASLASGIITELQENVEYDGLVLETGVPQYLKPAFELLMKIIRATWRKNALLIIPISPPRPDAGGRAWDHELLSEFAPIVDYFSVMSYDYFEPSHSK